MLPLLGLLAPVAKLVMGVIDKAVPDKDLREKLKAEASAQLLSQDNKEFMTHLKEAGSIIRAEANSESWIARNWRPMIMLLFGAIVANNYVLYPYLSLFFEAAPILDVPESMWSLLKIGLGGYVLSRGAEKTMAIYKGKQ
jgi:hypothetical protein